GMPRCRGRGRMEMRSLALEDGEVFQHRDDADHDDDDAHDVFCAAVEWQHIHQIEDENDNQKRDQHTDQNVHTWLLASLAKEARQLMRQSSKWRSGRS